jgi:hypothetical protein
MTDSMKTTMAVGCKEGCASFDREELQLLRKRARIMSCVPDTNTDWIRAFDDLASAADRLDAMLARCSCTERDECPSENVPLEELMNKPIIDQMVEIESWNSIPLLCSYRHLCLAQPGLEDMEHGVLHTINKRLMQLTGGWMTLRPVEET